MRKTAVRKTKREKIVNIDNDIINAILTGDPQSTIVNGIRKKHPNLVGEMIESRYEHCFKLIVERTSLSAEEVINLHVIWYERLYKLFKILDHVPGQLAAMRQKEKILGLLKEDNVIKIENEVNVKVGSEPEYDMNKLTPEERERMEKYLKLIS